MPSTPAPPGQVFHFKVTHPVLPASPLSSSSHNHLKHTKKYISQSYCTDAHLSRTEYVFCRQLHRISLVLRLARTESLSAVHSSSHKTIVATSHRPPPAVCSAPRVAEYAPRDLGALILRLDFLTRQIFSIAIDGLIGDES